MISFLLQPGVVSLLRIACHNSCNRLILVAYSHGFRSDLCNWLAKITDVPYEVAEIILGHVVGDKGERASLYRLFRTALCLYGKMGFLCHRSKLRYGVKFPIIFG